MEEEEVRLSQAQESTKTWREPKLKRQTKAENSVKRASGRALRTSAVALIVSLLALGHFGGVGALGADRHSADSTQGVFVSQPSHAIGHKDNVLKAVRQKIGKLHIPFIKNQGQTDAKVTFYAPTFGGTVFVTQKGAFVYALSQGKGKKQSQGVTLREELVGGKVKAVQGEGQTTTKLNYFKGNNRSKWANDIPTYDCVSLGEVYAGVEVKLKAYGHTTEKLFYVRPGGRPEQIKLRMRGGKGLKITKQGELEVETKLGTVTFSKPVAYQEEGGKQELVAVAYVVKGNEYGFKVGEYDKTKELVIDPILAATFLGGSAGDSAAALALDSMGNVYVAGSTESSDFPGVGAGSADRTFAGNREVFVAKLDANLGTLLAATFLGGSSGDSANALALDSMGNVYVAGSTETSDFPGIGAGSADSTFSGFQEAFVAKLDANLSRLLAATFLGGSIANSANALALDSMGNVYVAGQTFSADFPGIGAGSADSTFSEFGEAFVAKLDANLSRLLAATFLGGTRSDSANALALGSMGNVYVAGSTGSSDFPGIGAGSADSTFSGDQETFVAKLDANLSRLLAATFLGGSSIRIFGDFDRASALALDSMGNVYVAGSTSSPDFPGIGAGSADSTFGLPSEAFVAKLDANLGTLLGATFLGGGPFTLFTEIASALSLDRTGNVYVAGGTVSADFPGIGVGSADSTFAGFSEAFVAKLDANLSRLLAATFLGGSSSEGANALALDSMGNVYVAGSTGSSDFPGIGAGSADRTYAGNFEVFVAKLDPNLSGDVCKQQIVNDLVTFVVTQTSLDPTPGPGAPAGRYTITARLTNASTEDIFQPLKVDVVTLSNGNRLVSATEGNGGPGSKQGINAGADDTLTANESVLVQFVIGLVERSPFSFLVNVEGCVLPPP